jgi:hypothetical protein
VFEISVGGNDITKDMRSVSGLSVIGGTGVSPEVVREAREGAFWAYSLFIGLRLEFSFDFFKTIIVVAIKIAASLWLSLSFWEPGWRADKPWLHFSCCYPFGMQIPW